MTKDLPITRRGVQYAYRYLLGREPENEEAYAFGLSAGTVETLRRWILDSPEFAEQLATAAPLLLTHDLAARMAPPREPGRGPAGAFFANNLVVHTHIEKCAGTSLYVGLQRLFGRHFCLDLRNPRLPRPQDLLPEGRAGIRLLSGHFHYGHHLAEFDRTPLCIATVRDPVERLVSYLRFLRQSPSHPQYEDYGRLPLAEAVSRMEEKDSPFVRNGQCLVLCGQPSFEAARENVEARYLLVLPHRSANRIPPMFAEALGLAPPSGTVWLNVSAAPVEELAPEPALLERIRALNAEDDRLFRWVQENEARLTDRAARRLAELVAYARATDFPPGPPP